MKILVIEDEYISSAIMFNLLIAYGECDQAEDGYEGIKLVEKAFKLENPYDVIFIDVMMPKLNGIRVLEEIRKIESLYIQSEAKKIPVIMTTALGNVETIDKSFERECSAYLVKPITKDRLIYTFKDLNLA